MELNGRSEGAGALQIMAYEYKQCPTLKSLPSISKKFTRLEQFKSRLAYRFVNIIESGPLELEQADRIELDNLILEAFGFHRADERKEVVSEVYAWLSSRVRERLTKPMTGPEGVSESGEGRANQADLREFS
jgi:hypothetical protein